MLGPISRVKAFSTYDALAEVPVLGTITSAVRMTQAIVTIAYNCLKYPFKNEEAKTKLRENIKFSLVALKFGAIESIPLFGNFQAYKLNKGIADERNNHSLQEMQNSLKEKPNVKISTAFQFIAKSLIKERENTLSKFDRMNQAQLQQEFDKFNGKKSFNAFETEIYEHINSILTPMKYFESFDFMPVGELKKTLTNIEAFQKPVAQIHLDAALIIIQKIPQREAAIAHIAGMNALTTTGGESMDAMEKRLRIKSETTGLTGLEQDQLNQIRSLWSVR